MAIEELMTASEAQEYHGAHHKRMIKYFNEKIKESVESFEVELDPEHEDSFNLYHWIAANKELLESYGYTVKFDKGFYSDVSQWARDRWIVSYGSN